MDHRDHVRLLQKGVPGPGRVWADFGSGAGAFTLALADLLGPEGVIHSIDRNSRAIRQQQRHVSERFPRLPVHYHTHDYTEPLALPPLDGLIMANALHFQRKKRSVVRLLTRYLRPGGHFMIVEYDTDRGNHWVPYPLSFESWKELATEVGLGGTRLLATERSSFLGRFYAALSLKRDGEIS